MNDLDLCLEVF